MQRQEAKRVRVQIVAVPETAGSALYGMIDVLNAAGVLWDALTSRPVGAPHFEIRIVSPDGARFRCLNGIPVEPDCSLNAAPPADIVILPELWLAVDDPMEDRYAELMDWIRRRYSDGAFIYSACSGAVMMAASGLLKGREATSHWAYQDMFRARFPETTFRPEPNLVFAEPTGRIVTAGGTTSWHDLAIHIIARHCSPEEAVRIAKVYLLKWHNEGQAPYTSLVRYRPHADAAVRRVQDWLADHFSEADALSRAVQVSGVPERSLKRRFKAATGSTLISHIQNLRVEEAKRLLEGGAHACEDVAPIVGYENAAFFRRLFKRSTGLAPAQYRRMFQPVRKAAEAPAPA
ncbi:MAG: helix-turn-helix domain-containing protein [Marivibrio sp.]|uniref:GlxA family transcriptional regulator n=1 Tax=Marivibrio sp. TaxID=2039719 RepID=UPI0032EDCB75